MAYTGNNTPEIPPGMVFISNHSGWDDKLKQENNEMNIADKMSKELNIPVEDITVLEGVAPMKEFTKFSSFADIKWQNRISAWHDYVEAMINMMRLSRD